MKMEQPLVAHKAGLISALTAVVGDGVSAGTILCEIRDSHSDAPDPGPAAAE